MPTQPTVVSGARRTAAPAIVVIFCLVPSALAGAAHEPLRAHFHGDHDVDVIVDRRHVERRALMRRRAPSGPVAAEEERRRVRSESGLRVADRRGATRPAPPPPLPSFATSWADRLRFVECEEPTTQASEDHDSARAVLRFQNGDRAAFDTLYKRYFDRVYGQLRSLLRDAHEAEDVTQEVFVRALRALSTFEWRERPFRHWLFRIARNCALTSFEHRPRLPLDAWEPAAADRAAPSEVVAPSRELLFALECVPLEQRQALLMRDLLGLSSAEAAARLGRSPEAVRQLQVRAVRSLRIELGR